MALAVQVSKPGSDDAVLLVAGLLALLLLIAAPLLARALATAAPAIPELRLEIDRGGDYALDGRPLGQAALTAALREAEARSPGVRLRIATADDSDPRALAGVLAMAEQAGVRNIGSELR